MGKHPSIRITTDFPAVCPGFCGGQHISRGRYNISPDNAFRKGILSFIIRTVNKRLALTGLKVDKIGNHSQKYRKKQVGNHGKFPVSGSIIIRLNLIFLLKTRDILFSALFFQLFQTSSHPTPPLLPSGLPAGYIIPG